MKLNARVITQIIARLLGHIIKSYRDRVHVRTILLSIVMFTVGAGIAPAIAGTYYVGPALLYIHSSNVELGDYAAVGLQGGVGILQGSWGLLALGAELGLPVSGGEQGSTDGDWSMSWIKGSLSYRTPGRLFGKAYIGFTNAWLDFDPEDFYLSGETSGGTIGAAIGYSASDRLTFQLDGWIIAEFLTQRDEHEGYAYRFGMSCLANF